MKTVTILLIEDNPPDVRLIKEMLKDISHFKSNLISMVTLNAGCEQIQKKNFDIILLDLNLPDSTGRQTFKKVIDCNNEIPVVLITGMEDEKLSSELIIEGAQDYIIKKDLTSILLGKTIQFSIERKKSQETLQAAKEYLDSIINNVASPIFVKDDKHKFCTVNDAFCKLLNVSVEKIIGQTDDDYFPEEQMKVFFAKDQEVFITGKENINEELLTDGTGKIRTIVTRKTLYTDPAGNKFLIGIINDITERKLAEDALKESEESYRKLFENHSAVKIILDPDTGAIIDANDAAAKYYGWTREEMKQMRLNQISTLSPIDMNTEMERVRSGRQIHNEFRHRRADGSVRDVEVFSSIIEIRGKDVLHSIIQDITERKRAEETLKISKERLLFSTEGANLGIWNWDTVTGELIFSNLCKSFFGIGLDQTMNYQRFTDALYPDDRERTDKAVKDALDNHKDYDIEYRSLWPDESIHWLASKGRGYYDATGKAVRFEGVVQDITERKRAEEALLQSEKNFRRSISESPVGIRIVSIAGKTIYVNKAYLDIFEFNSLEEFTKMSAINRYTPESFAQHQERKAKRKNGHEVFEYEVSIVRANMEIRHLKIWRREILWNGAKHYQVINLDITEHKKLTADLIAAKEHAEESDKLKSAFLSNMSHEIRTPMNGILGFAGLLKAHHLRDEDQQEYIRIIEESGKRMLNIINDIVDISKIESGLMNVSNKESNVNQQIEYIYTFFKPAVEEKGMKFFFKNPLPQKDAIIITDREKIFAILTNLVKNAIKFSNKGSIELGYEKKGNYLEFFVKDTGIGIPADRQKAIFDRFVQADIGDKRAFQGAGLGLSISKAYVELLGGNIWVESEEGKGSVFYFTIPCNSEQKEKNVITNVFLSAEAENKMKALKILIADDDGIGAMLLTLLVRKISKEVIIARNGVEAVEACRKNLDIDLVLMDLKMPEMDGFEATRKIRKFNKDIIIIAQTAYTLMGHEAEAIEAGCNSFISKPILKDKLIQLIQRYFNN